ncbi:MAG: DUF1223 domain-containing protein [Candidatus Binataceae bacterium]
MKQHRPIQLIVSVAIIAMVAIVVRWGSPAMSEAAAAAGRPVVLELFTSQGCSSCPPADALLSSIGASGSPGVIPLAFHVDYWNHWGWRDPFSSRDWSLRQSDYSRAMGLDGEYTPQAVINGSYQCVGSDRGDIARAIASARSRPATARLEVGKVRYEESAHTLTVKIKAELTHAADHPVPVMVALYENGLVTKIGAGENSGRQIVYDYTVRQLSEAFEVGPAAGKPVARDIKLNLDPAWNTKELGIAVFVQDPASLHIGDAVAEYPVAKN